MGCQVLLPTIDVSKGKAEEIPWDPKLPFQSHIQGWQMSQAHLKIRILPLELSLEFFAWKQKDSTVYTFAPGDMVQRHKADPNEH